MTPHALVRAPPWVAAVLACGFVAAACVSSGASEDGDDPSLTPTLPSPSVITTGTPEAFDAAALETAFPIKHVVFLIK
ncbi:MAG TPA: hypothetical protein VE669_05655, partial [Actinomycetota bacterium]|nr:hypothetical protein [Actinomycetota bacterium]